MNNQVLITEIKNIRTDLSELNDCYEELYSLLKTNIIIDKKTIREDDLSKLKTNTTNIISEINVDIIPMINNM